MSLINPSYDQEILAEFREDSYRLILDADPSLALLSKDIEDFVDSDPQELSNLVRTYTSIKGSAEFLGIRSVELICERLVILFQNFRKNPSQLDANGFAFLSSGIDFLRSWLDPKHSGSVPQELDEAQTLWVQKSQQFEKDRKVLQPETPSSNQSFDEEQPFDFQIVINPEMLQTFLLEAQEQLETAETSLLALEKNLQDNESLQAAFRAIHTLKGNCGLFNFADMERLGHDFESILEDFKNGKLLIDHNGITLLLRSLDILKSCINEMPDGKGEIGNLDVLLKTLSDYRTKGIISQFVGKGGSSLLGEVLVEMGALEREQLEAALFRQTQPLGEILLEMNLISPDTLQESLEIQKEQRRLNETTTLSKTASNANIRVDLLKLEQLINLVGELIIAENMVTKNPDLEGQPFENFRKASAQLNRITRDLQDISMSLRMMPIESTFRKMQRVVRDIATKQGKLVTLTMRGEDTEVDKNVAENLSNPLLHLVRNALDHGIERPEVRAAKGKDRTGTLVLEAYHEGGEVVIKIGDDGNGLDPEKILAKAIEKGMLPPNSHFSNPQELYPLIFEPGFSTAEKLSDISGRGVGMDVAKRNIESIHGRIYIQSALGKSTEFTIRIPLTLAIIEGMLIRVGQSLFTIPLLSMRETFRASPSMLFHTMGDQYVVKIRTNLIPVHRLDTHFKIPSENRSMEDGILLVVENRDESICIFVDEIIGQYQTVIKGLSPYLGKVEGISGTSILSNGDISLILDIQTLIESAKTRTSFE